MVNIINQLREKRNINKHKFYGYVEVITTGRIRGWAYSKATEINEVGLFVNGKLVASSKIEGIRKDVNKKFKINKATEFEILLTPEINDLDKQNFAQIIALDINRNKIFKIKIVNQKSQNKINLQKIIRNKFIGYDGRIDKINDSGLIIGWGVKRNSDEFIDVWLQAEGLSPIKIKCNTWREGLEDFNIPKNRGFEINPNNLSTQWQGKEIFISFDIEGLNKLENYNAIIIPKTQKSEKPKRKSIDEIYEKERNQLEYLKSQIDRIESIRTIDSKK